MFISLIVQPWSHTITTSPATISLTSLPRFRLTVLLDQPVYPSSVVRSYRRVESLEPFEAQDRTVYGGAHLLGGELLDVVEVDVIHRRPPA